MGTAETFQNQELHCSVQSPYTVALAHLTFACNSVFAVLSAHMIVGGRVLSSSQDCILSVAVSTRLVCTPASFTLPHTPPIDGLFGMIARSVSARTSCPFNAFPSSASSLLFVRKCFSSCQHACSGARGLMRKLCPHAHAHAFIAMGECMGCLAESCSERLRGATHCPPWAFA